MKEVIELALEECAEHIRRKQYLEALLSLETVPEDALDPSVHNSEKALLLYVSVCSKLALGRSLLLYVGKAGERLDSWMSRCVAGKRIISGRVGWVYLVNVATWGEYYLRRGDWETGATLIENGVEAIASTGPVSSKGLALCFKILSVFAGKRRDFAKSKQHSLSALEHLERAVSPKGLSKKETAELFDLFVQCYYSGLAACKNLTIKWEPELREILKKLPKSRIAIDLIHKQIQGKKNPVKEALVPFRHSKTVRYSSSSQIRASQCPASSITTVNEYFDHKIRGVLQFDKDIKWMPIKNKGFLKDLHTQEASERKSLTCLKLKKQHRRRSLSEDRNAVLFNRLETLKKQNFNLQKLNEVQRNSVKNTFHMRRHRTLTAKSRAPVSFSRIDPKPESFHTAKNTVEFAILELKKELKALDAPKVPYATNRMQRTLTEICSLAKSTLKGTNSP